MLKINNFLLKYTTPLSINTVRSFSRRKKVVDPGISGKKKLFNADEAKDVITADYEDLEADFHKLHLTQKEHLTELEAWKEQEKLLIVKQKYFKEKFPNFLTWADKEQIKHLNKQDPEKWNIEKLSEGFPALPDIIAKIIKNNWSKSTTEKIKNHDKNVIKNWASFRKGEMKDLPKELIDHLQKFTNRELNLNATPIIKEQNKIKIPKGEFSEIITSYKKSNETELELIEDNSYDLEEEKQKMDTYVKSGGKSLVKRNVTLREYGRLTGDIFTKQEKIKAKDVASEVNEEINLDVAKYMGGNGKVNLYKPSRDYSHLTYPDKIIIPTNKRRRGCTYKLNDCYYDHDGEFLYRVPGMG